MRPRASPAASSAPHVAASSVAVKYTYVITRPCSKFDSRPGTSMSPIARSAFVPCRYTPGSYTSNGTGSLIALLVVSAAPSIPSRCPHDPRWRDLLGHDVAGIGQQDLGAGQDQQPHHLGRRAGETQRATRVGQRPVGVEQDLEPR